MRINIPIQRRLNATISRINMYRFWVIERLLSFDAANVFLQGIDKNAIQLVLKKNGASIGKDCDIESGLFFHNCRDYSNLIIGNNCHVGKSCFFDLRGKVVIEDNVVVSMQTTFITHQDLNKSDLREIYPPSFSDVTIKKNSYIGANATILQGITVNQYSVIAAGAVVTEDVPEYSVVGGVPAKLIKHIEKI